MNALRTNEWKRQWLALTLATTALVVPTLAGCQQGQNGMATTAAPTNAEYGGPSAADAETPNGGNVAGPPAALGVIPVDAQVNHKNGAVLRVTQVERMEDRTILDISVTNGHRDTIRLNNAKDMVLMDEAGNSYPVQPPPQNEQVEVQPGATLKGRFVFIGPLPTGTTRLSLVTNGKFGTDASFTSSPRFRVENLPAQPGQAMTPNAANNAGASSVAPSAPMNSAPGDSASGSAPMSPAGGDMAAPAQPSGGSTITTTEAAPAPAVITVNKQVNHANGSVLRVGSLSLEEDRMVADLSCTNGYKFPIRLNNASDMVLTDDKGNRYNLLAPPHNEDVEIAAGSTLKGKFVFMGRLAPDATSLQLVCNGKFGTSASYSSTPKFVVSGIEVRR
jgi:hypothetical protein